MAHGACAAVRLTWIGRGAATRHDSGGRARDRAGRTSSRTSAAADAAATGFSARGRARRRARFLRKARELAYRDLGGLVFNLHRFGQRNDPLVLAKLTTLGAHRRRAARARDAPWPSTGP